MTAPAPKRPDTRPVESLGDRVDAMVGGAVLTAGILYAAGQTEFVSGITHENEPYLKGELHHVAPLGAIVAYLLMVHVVRPWYSARPGAGLELRPLLQAWNLFLCVLSVVMLAGMAGPLALHAYANSSSLYDVMCDAPQERWVGMPYFFVWVFALSKFAELVDTVFLVVRKRPVNFLHWYHHASVLAYTWYAVAYRFTPGWYFACVNAFVHTIMYWYYFRRACGVKLTYDKIITQVQLSQMVLGIAVSGLWSYYHLVDPRPCPADQPVYMIVAGVAMYASYFFLFAAFYVNRYRKAKAAKAAKSQ